MKDTDGFAILLILGLFVLMLFPIPTELFLLIVGGISLLLSKLMEDLDKDPKYSDNKGLPIIALGIYGIVFIITLIMLVSS